MQRPHLPDGRRRLVRDQQVRGNSLRTLFLEAFVLQATLRGWGVTDDLLEIASPMCGPVLEQPGTHEGAGTA